MKKLKLLFFCSMLVAASSSLFADSTTTMCDATNNHTCTIEGVGTATGKLITTTKVD